MKVPNILQIDANICITYAKVRGQLLLLTHASNPVNLFLSLVLKCVSCRQPILRCFFFLIRSENLCLSIGMIITFTIIVLTEITLSLLCHFLFVFFWVLFSFSTFTAFFCFVGYFHDVISSSFFSIELHFLVLLF